MTEPRGTIKGDFMRSDPVADLLRDVNTFYQGEDAGVLGGCEDVIIKGLSLMLQHPHKRVAEENRDGSRFLEKGVHIVIPPVNYEGISPQNPSQTEPLGLLWLSMLVPTELNSWQRIRLEMAAGPHTGKIPKSVGAQEKIIEVTPAYIRRYSQAGPIPGRRQDINFSLDIIRKIEAAVLPKK